MPTPCLKEFIATVPICTEKTSLGAVLNIFQWSTSGSDKAKFCFTDRLVEIDEQQRPLGVLHLSSLLPYLNLSKLAIADEYPLPTPLTHKVGEIEGTEAIIDAVLSRTYPGSIADRSSGTLRQPQITNPLNWHQPLSELGNSLFSPLVTLPADLSLNQFWPYLQNHTNGASPEWALVDQAGKFLGLLDTQRLLQFLANRCSPETIDNSAPTETLTQAGIATGDRVWSVEKDADTKTHATAPEELKTQTNLIPENTLHPLIQLLERLPLPIMLQTASGESVTQNLAWRKHLGGLQDPEWLRREAAALLEAVPLSRDNPADRANTELYPSESSASPPKPFDFSVLPVSPSDWKTFDRTMPTSSIPKLCQIGADPDSCICICPMQNGSERVWQFVKIPLGNVLFGQDLSLSEKITTRPSSRTNASTHQFRLATLRSTANGFLGKTATTRNIPSSPRASVNRPPAPATWSIEKDDTSTPQISHPNPSEALWLVVATDVTEQQQVAKELAAKNADLILLNRLKDEFLACISHELKTPLTAILGLSSLLKDRLLGELNDRQIRYARLIHQSGRHLMTVVNDILDLTRMETGQLELTLAPVDIASICDRAYQQSRQLYLGKHKIEEEEVIPTVPEPNFTLSIEVGLDNLIADEMRLRQMLVHLLSNALKFTEQTGSIGLRVNRWEGWIAFTVWDTGIGIPDQKQHLIFQKFQQLENPLTRQFDGTGLGLVLTQRLARLHGGDVTFISKPGKGSEFTLLLPPSPPRTEEQGSGGAGERGGEERSYISHSPFPIPHSPFSISYPSSRLVLVVEAAPKSIEDLSEKLTGLGYRVAIARSGTEALEKARRLQPCAIFLNPLIPLLSGWDVLTLLKASAQTQHIPVIVTATRAEKEYAFGKRADGFLSLPVQQGKLRHILERLANTAKTSEQAQRASTNLTVLRLSAGLENNSLFLGLDADLNRLLHQYHYRVLEAEDLDQAELLARIWQPDVVLLEGEISNPLAYLEQLSQHAALASLPLVTLDEAATKAALQIELGQGSLPLQVFPCLGLTGSLPEASTLLQAIQVAAGMSYKPSILVVDVSALPDLIEPFGLTMPSDSQYDRSQSLPTMAMAKKRAEWLQALVQYLQTAGFKGAIGHSWEEVLRQVQHRSIDLLLLDLGDSIPSPILVKALCSLRPIEPRPSTLILTRRINSSETPLENPVSVSPYSDVLAPTIGEVATRILPASLSMEELLEQIRQVLA